MEKKFKKIFILSMLIISTTICSTEIWAEERPSLADGEKIYMHYCTSCHGVKGDGEGFNAKNLDPRPANHIDVEFMNKRTDQDLYDVIRGGGRAVGKSTLMPPWGNTFRETQIKSLILHMRKLCKCQGL